MATTSEIASAVRLAAKALDNLVQQRGATLAKRKRLLEELEYSGYKDKALLGDLESDASDREYLTKGMAMLELSLKNADAVLTEMDRQAKKDSERVLKGAGLAEGSSAKVKAQCKQLGDSLAPVQQKATYVTVEFENLLEKIRADNNLPGDQRKKIYAKAGKQVEEITQSLENLTNNLDGAIGSLRSVGIK